MNDRHVDRCQVAVVRTAIRETLSSQILMSFDRREIVLALEELTSDLKQRLATEDSDIFVDLQN
ncbi:MAG: hypothetical protein LH660_00510 [Phormidesmis sp. CAN_BIN36]|nr:hypothetical protein [Phormidesmis sp. CAN_BIN36]